MNSAPPEISILIPAFNEESLIGEVIDSVRQSFAALAPRGYEIIVCDNNSTDRTAEIALGKGARVMPEPHNQIARARNTAAKAARGTWLIFLDADTFLSPALLKNTVAALESGQVCGGGSVLAFDSQSIGFFAGLLLKTWNPVSALLGLAAGSYLFCYREAWVETGGFDETVYAGEEIFFSRKLKRWARERGLKFKVLTAAPILTSARKMEWYGQWEIISTMLRMAWPGTINRREKCGLWYTRPTPPPAK
jgi:glycosyltransferase involved in cell wall biosynthesis